MSAATVKALESEKNGIGLRSLKQSVQLRPTATILDGVEYQFTEGMDKGCPVTC